MLLPNASWQGAPDGSALQWGQRGHMRTPSNLLSTTRTFTSKASTTAKGSRAQSARRAAKGGSSISASPARVHQGPGPVWRSNGGCSAPMTPAVSSRCAPCAVTRGSLRRRRDRRSTSAECFSLGVMVMKMGSVDHPACRRGRGPSGPGSAAFRGCGWTCTRGCGRGPAPWA